MRCNILPAWTLLDQHLIAERRELRMIPPLLKKRVRSSNSNLLRGIPERYTLGKGHMLFWINKMLYLSKRFDELTQEMIKREFKPNQELQFDLSLATKYGLDLDWEPNPEDYDIIVRRLREKINQRLGWYKYCGVPVTSIFIDATYPLPYFS